MKEGDRLAEVMGAVSLAAAHARGQAAESLLGTTILATRMAGVFGLSSEETTDTYYTALARALGCTSTAMESSPMAWGDDITFSYALNISDFTDLESIRSNLERYWVPDGDPEAKALAIAQTLEVLPQLAEVPLAHGHQATALGRRLPVPSAVSGLLAEIDARWDGMNPFRAAAEDIPVPLRIIEFALVAEMYRRAGGVPAVLEMAKVRSGGQFDPKVCDAFADHTDDLVDGFEANSLWDLFLELEPRPRLLLEDRHIKPVAEVTADFADNKSGWTVGHSRIVADTVRVAAEHVGLSDADQRELVLAGLMHDVGRCAVPNGVWDKPGELSDGERRMAQSHSRYTEEILAASDALRPSAFLAGAVHERLDGSGYHHASRLRDIQPQLLAAADVFAALTQERPWRDAYSHNEAAEIMLKEADSGKLSLAAVKAILESGSDSASGGRTATIDGLTPREIEVLAHLAQGLLTKQIAARLGIAYKTADNHIQSIYAKIGANSRTAAAMYAMEHGVYSAS